MYDVRGVLPVDELSPGRRLLGVGPPMVGLERLSHRFLARGLDADEAGIVVSTDRPGSEVLSAVEAETTVEGVTAGLGIIDATGAAETTDPAAPHRVARTGSPDDLTGIGMRFSELVETLHDDGYDRFRFVVDSVSSLLVYSEFERVYRFLHVLSTRISGVDGVALALLHADTDGDQADRLRELFDGTLSVREAEGGVVEWRLRGVEGTGGAWHPAAPLSDDRSVAVSADPDRPGAGAAGADGDGGAGAAPASHGGRSSTLDLTGLSSLRDAIDRVRAGGHTLTLCNPGDGAVVEELSPAFASLNTRVRTATLSTDTPRDAALLHRGDELVAAEPVEELRTAVRVEEPGTGAGPGTPETLPDESAVLSVLDREAYTVENGGKLEMVRISRLVENRALRAGSGELHAGFQRLSRLDDELRTRTLYDRLAASGVETHLYGEHDDDPGDEHVVHGGAGELADAWFVVFDGGETGRPAALVSVETAPGAYSGFWTFQPALVEPVLAYLDREYGSTEAPPARP